MADQGTRFGKYELLDVLGEGGMAVVHRAIRSGPMGFRKKVALKLLKPHVLQDGQVVDTIINEARLGGYLQHRNIVEVHEFDQVDDSFYIAMEFVPGHTLDRVLARVAEQGPIPPFVVAEVALQLCAGLEYAHTLCDDDGAPLGLVHRDLKPPNVIVSHRGVVKIMDFGIAKAATNVEQTDVSNTTKGTPLYMSPEQARGDPVDGRSDLFALGSILAEMITGRVVFDDDTLAGVLMRINTADLGDTIQEVARHAPVLAPIIRRALALSPDHRFAGARAMADAIEAVRDEIPDGPPLAAWLQEWMADPGDPRPSAGDVSLELPPPETDEFFGIALQPEEVEQGASPDPLEEFVGDVSTVRWAEPLRAPSEEVFRDVTEMELGGLLEEEEAPDVVVTRLPGLVLVRIQPGAFWMGSDRGEPGRYDDEDRHQVQLTLPFRMATTPVTQGQWEEVMGLEPGRPLTRKVPVRQVSWYDAIKFCNRLSRREGRTPAYGVENDEMVWDRGSPGFRLPTEAEWEYAARAGTTTLYAGSNDPDEVAWYWKSSRASPRTVARKAPNAWGLYDMSGNVWEWIWDRYGPYTTEGVEFDPLGAEAGPERCARGGSYYSKPRDLRLTCRRGRARPKSRLDFLGFRVVATVVD